jgi:hypothetical protein
MRSAKDDIALSVVFVVVIVLVAEYAGWLERLGGAGKALSGFLHQAFAFVANLIDTLGRAAGIW